MEFKIHQTSLNQILILRQKVLKPHLAIEECQLIGDLSEETTHWALTLHTEKSNFQSTKNDRMRISELKDSDKPKDSETPFSEEIISIASLHREAHPILKASNPFRLRGMATLESFKNQGWGTLLLKELIEFVKVSKGDLFWFTAREKAFPFYEKQSFIYHGENFDLPQIGPHKVMYRYFVAPKKE